VVAQWAPEDTSTPIKPDSKAAPRAASRSMDEADRSLAAAGIQTCSSNSSYCALSVNEISTELFGFIIMFDNHSL